MSCYTNLKIKKLASSNKKLLIKKCKKYKISTNGEKIDLARKITVYEERLFLKKYNLIGATPPKNHNRKQTSTKIKKAIETTAHEARHILINLGRQQKNG